MRVLSWALSRLSSANAMIIRYAPGRSICSACSALSLLLIVAGAGLIFYVALQYWAMYSEQRELAVKWEHQQQVDTLRQISQTDGLTRISIPKINLDAIVVEGTSRRALLLGPGHLRETPAPGEIGNAVISGHRDTFFRHLHELATGDVFTVRRNGQAYIYQVTGKKVVPPSDLSVLTPSKDPQLTLITCYPTYYIGPAPERLVVFSRLANVPTDAKLTGDNSVKNAAAAAR